MIYTVQYESPLGGMQISEKDGALTGIWFADRPPLVRPEEKTEPQETPLLVQACRWLDSYFGGENPPAKALQIHLQGSFFQQEVWTLLREIPYGRVTSYGELAKKIARRRGIKCMAAQAVGGAVGRNPIAILVPCHRVIGADGSPVGYAGGLERKKKLLHLEGVTLDSPQNTGVFFV